MPRTARASLTRRTWIACAATLVGFVMSVPSASRADASYPRAAVTGPVTGGVHGRAYLTSVVDLASWHYTEREYFVSGTAMSGGATELLPPTDEFPPSPYMTRILVRQPPPDRFNGTVVVEWLNVTSGTDFDADWAEGYRELLRGGYAYVGVSAQSAGVGWLKMWDSERYGSLQQPGDAYAHSIFGQVLATLRHPNGVNPLPGLDVHRIIADGHSMSGLYLHAFIDQVQSEFHLADGFLVRGEILTSYDWAHLKTPVLQYQSESEIDGPVGLAIENPTYDVQPTPFAADHDNFRLWQVAGSSHVGQESQDYQLDEFSRDWLSQPPSWDEAKEGLYDGSGGTEPCVATTGTGTLDEFPQWYTLDAAFHALNDWVITGQPPRNAPRITLTSGGAPVRDAHGNAIGGVRDPVVDVPLASYSGDQGCGLWGFSARLAESTVKALYPTRAAYLHKLRDAADAAERNAWLLPYDKADLLARAAQITV
jgi:hypothetical protein